MKQVLFLLSLFILLFSTSCNSEKEQESAAEQQPQITFQEHIADKRIDVLIAGKPFTTLRWPDNVTKPVLYPIVTGNGSEVTRGFPIHPKIGERADHPHQIGNYLTYGNVNGSDFWGNGSHGLGNRNSNGGVIQMNKIENVKGGAGEGKIVASASWIDSTGQKVMDEQTEYYFIAEDSVRIIDRITTLAAGELEVHMPDTKEGMFGIRVARELELPAQGEITLYSANGEPEKVKAMNNEAISGDYLSSEGVTGLDVWGTRARWMDLYGNIDGEKISLVICDHPDNPSYPTWWHARGYGLFSANPLGAADFTKGKETVDFGIPSGQSVTFKYRMIISSGSHLSSEDIDAYADEFADTY